MEPKWLEWAKKLQSIAQAGLEYSHDKYDLERFTQIRELSAEIVSRYTGVGDELVKDLFCNETGYQTPKVDVRAAVFRDDRMLLVRESTDGLWSMPGGWAEPYLSPAENAAKEVMEEAGLNVVPRRLIAVLDRNRRNPVPYPYGAYKIFLLCDLLSGGAFKENIETEESGFFRLDDLPPLSVGRVTREQVEMCFKFAAGELQVPVFD